MNAQIHVNPLTMNTHGLATKIHLTAVRTPGDNGVTIYKFWDGVFGTQLDRYPESPAEEMIRNFFGRHTSSEESGKRHWSNKEWREATPRMKWHRIQVFALRMPDGSLSWDAGEAADALDQLLDQA